MVGGPGPDEGWLKTPEPRLAPGHRALGDPACDRPTQGTDIMGAACPACGHTPLMHPGGPTNPRMGVCLICEIEILRDELRAELEKIRAE